MLPITLYEPLTIIDNNVLTWVVSQQINNSHFEIEHSSDGSLYKHLAKIEGEGNSSIVMHYHYTHVNQIVGNNYYRIKQVDYDGKYSYSNIASVRYNGNEETSIYPNPASSEVTVNVSSPTTLQIIDVFGRVLTNQDISEGQSTINVSTIPTGILNFVIGDHRYRVFKK